MAGIDVVTLALAKKYVSDSMIGAGAVKGKDGKDGITPHIGNNGNWFIGTQDTGVKAETIDGKDGFNPRIVENSGNDNSTYKLDITTESGTIVTPNLRGERGFDGYPFLIYKEYASLDEFNASDFPEVGLMFMIKEDGATLFPIYRYTGETETPYSHITDLSGSEGIKGDKGEKGETGNDGFSPTVTTNPGNNDSTYKLDITTKTETITTPNLKGADGVDGQDGQDGADGEDGFSPVIAENADNNDDVYKLDITTKTGTSTTPNLKGGKGSDGSKWYASEGIPTVDGNDNDMSLDTSNGSVYQRVNGLWEDTGLDIKGSTGASIQKVEVNTDNTVTCVLTNGTELTSDNPITTIKGDKGADGKTPEFTIGEVNTVSNSTNASANITGTAENPVLNLNIPKGADGTVDSTLYGKVKLNDEATDAHYLAELVDNATITIDEENHCLCVKRVEGLTATVAEINFLGGVTSNIQEQINNLGKPMAMYGVFNTKADLIAKTDPVPEDGSTAIVIADETNDGKQMTYIYIGVSSEWTQVAESSVSVRDFTTNPINLATEATGILQKEKIDTAIARLADVLDAYSYKGSAAGVVKSADTLNNLNYTIAELNTALAESHSHLNKEILDKIIANGLGNRLLADNGKYKEIFTVSSTEPTDTFVLWIDTTNTPVLKVHDGENWISISSAASTGGTGGKSAYDIAVEQGFQGSKTEWLASLKGETGEEGFSPIVTENANNDANTYKLDIQTETETITTPNLKGEKGNDGVAGKDGEKGADGASIQRVEVNDDNTLKCFFSNGGYSTSNNPITTIKGDKGTDGVTPNLTIGTVQSVSPNDVATATITGTATNPVLNLNIPRGKNGSADAEDEKVKLTSTSNDAQYLNDLLDNTTIVADLTNQKIVAKRLDGMNATVAEINFLTGIKSNIQQQIDNVNKSMTMYGVFDKKSDLINAIDPAPQDGNTAIVLKDETNDNKQMTYIYIANTSSWTQVAESTVEIRDFKTNPINLGDEVIGTLAKENIDTAIARLSDVLDKTSYKGSIDGVVKSADTLRNLEHTISELNNAIADAHSHINKNVLDGIINNGLGNKLLTDNGTYKELLVLSSVEPIDTYCIWVDTTTTPPILKVNNGTDWLEVSGGGSGTGKDGKSAYEIAVDNGFSGSEADWLESLKGKDGTAGEGTTPVNMDKWNTARNINGMSIDGSVNRFNYGVCSTNASTVAKIATCPGFELVTGSEITIKFTKTNTAANPTLNVNNTGAKYIYYKGTYVPTNYIIANGLYTLRYTGTNYEIVGDMNTGLAKQWDSPIILNGMEIDGSANRANYGTCSTSSTAKVISCTGFKLQTGASINVKFTRTDSYGTVSLNINNTGVKELHYKGTTIAANILQTNKIYTIVYDGSYYNIVGDIFVDKAAQWSTPRRINGMSIDGTADRVNYCTCGTTASTQTKSITCTGFEYVSGAQITIKFTRTNTAANPMLNINSLGAKYIYYMGTNIPAGYLKTNKLYTFVYTGTYFELVGDVNTGNTDTAEKLKTPRTINGQTFDGSSNIHNYGGCSTSGGTSAKTVSCSGFVLSTGAEITVRFSNTNTATTPTLNVNSTGAKAIYYRGTNVQPNYIKGGRLYTFRYTGSVYELVGDIFIDEAAKWSTPRAYNGINMDGTANVSNYVVCGTSAGSNPKSISCNGYQLLTGSEIAIKFTYGNTFVNPTLNIAGTGAKPIYYKGHNIPVGYIDAGGIYTFRYTGSAYELVGDVNVDTTYEPATQSKDGLMSSVDKKKLDELNTTYATNEFVNEQINNILSFNADGELVVTINGVSKVFVPKES